MTAYARGMPDPADAGTRNGGRPTIREVARRAGVSIATVSRVVTGADPVRAATRLRVEQAIASTGWVPDPAARQLAGAGGDHVMLVIGVGHPREFTADPHYARVIAGAQQEAAGRGLSLAVQLAQNRSAASLPYWRGARRCLGAILVNVESLEGQDLPLVSMGRSASSLPSVGPDNEAGAGAATRHLISRGGRRIGMVAGPGRNPCARERLAGYRSAVRSAGMREAVAEADFTRAGAARATRRLLAVHPDLDAIFAASDLMATAVLQVLSESGRRVPDDIALIGFDDSAPALMTTPLLSTVRQPVEELAALAVRTLLDPGADRPADRRLPTRLVIRASSAA
jgi:DNA-binding LacI/PurR family transcriptional regulator